MSPHGKLASVCVLMVTGFVLGASAGPARSASAAELRPSKKHDKEEAALKRRSDRRFTAALAKVAEVPTPPLLEAILSRDLQHVRRLIQRGADVNQRSESWTNTPLISAIKWAPNADKSYEIAEALLEAGANPDARDAAGTSCLGWAARVDRPDLVGLLVEAGAQVNVSNRLGSTPLVASVESPACVRVLLEAGADPNWSSPRWHGPLRAAVQMGRPETVRILIQHGADPNARGTDERTVLHEAAWLPLPHSTERIIAVLDELLAGGADVNAEDGDGTTPLHLAAEMARPARCGWLLENGARVDAADDSGTTPLHLAAYRGQQEIVAMLLEAGAPLDAQNGAGASPLHVAASRDRAEILRQLTARLENVDLRDNIGATALHAAAEAGSFECPKVLLEAGADVNARDSYGWTPLRLVEHQPWRLAERQFKVHSELVELLRREGGTVIWWDR
ncbi:MAG: ankyrin repeat domain-containing protein [Planctomycetota bacterium]